MIDFNTYKLLENYTTHDNGMMPFNVQFDKDKVFIFKQELQYQIKDVHIGTDTHKCCLPGSSVLLELDKSFILVSDRVIEFELEDFLNFYPILGNSSVSYPVIETKERFYNVIDKKYCLKKDIKDYYDMPKDHAKLFYESSIEMHDMEYKILIDRLI